MTIQVKPENLGPVTVQAHISADAVRIELFASNDAGRDALRQVLPDLRRDLAGSGMSVDLSLSSGNQPGNQPGGEPGREAFDRRGALANSDTPNSRQLQMGNETPGARIGNSGTDTILDVMA